jgi:hypothetical protein
MALRLDPQNPRLHSRKQLRQIANSIKSFGFNVPVLIDAEKSVIAGHGRILAAKALGWTEVPVIAIEHLDAAQRRAFAIADNRLTENSTWDDRLLAEQLRELLILRLPLPARRSFASIYRTTGSRSGRWPRSPTCSTAAIFARHSRISIRSAAAATCSTISRTRLFSSTGSIASHRSESLRALRRAASSAYASRSSGASALLTSILEQLHC